MNDYCSQALTCDSGETSSELRTSDLKGGFTHKQDIQRWAVIQGVRYEFLKFTREFEVSWQEQGTKDTTAIVRTSEGEFSCGGTGSYRQSGNLREYCRQEWVIPMYLNHEDEVFVYRRFIETVSFNVSAHPVKCRYKGGGSYWKFVVKKTGGKEALVGEEEFHVVHKGEDTLVNRVTWDRNPFPETSPQGVWGLYGDVNIALRDEPHDDDVRIILLFPAPPSRGIPQDFGDESTYPSVMMYGFYDYNEIGEGFERIGDALGELDGGKDMFYPAWLRAMKENPIMEAWAAERWDYRWNKVAPPPDGSWVPSEPETYPWPFGSFVIDPDGNYFFSGLYLDELNGVTAYNACRPADMIEKVMALCEPKHGGARVFYPITLISEAQDESAEAAKQNQDQNRRLTNDSGAGLTNDKGGKLYGG